ncbi:MAG: aldehyde dehydrogenase family protein [Cyclobacteriaceae bacterium]
MATAAKEKTVHTSTITPIFKQQKKMSIALRNEDIDDRKQRLKKIKKWVLDHRTDIQKAVYQDFKKPPEEVDLSEIYAVLTEVRHAIKHLHNWMKPKKVEAPLSLLGTKSRVVYEPKGVCLIIAPWNFPFNLAIGPLISALAAGNTVMLKPSELTPHTSQLIEDMINELFEPAEVAVFQGGKEIAQSLLALPFDHIFFTGSPQVGKIVMKAAAEHLTSVTLELGGKSPVIVDETANIPDAAEKIIWGKLLNKGQTCIAPDYVLVHQEVKESLIDEMKVYIDKLFDDEGKGIKESSQYARIINEQHFNRIHELIDQAVDLGAEIELGGETDIEECFIHPTLLRNVPKEATIMEEEIFGPVLPLVKFRDLTEAISYINSKPKPLALYIFSQTRSNQENIIKQTSSGTVAINDNILQFMHPELPFGGVNNSGIGKSHGHFGFLAFSNEKAVLKQKIGLTSVKPIYPPYNSIAKNAIELLLKYF